MTQNHDRSRHNNVNLIEFNHATGKRSVLINEILKDWINTPLMTRSSSGVMSMTGLSSWSKIPPIVNLLTPYDSNHVLTRKGLNELYLLDQNGVEMPYSSDRWYNVSTHGALTQVVFIEKDRFIALTTFGEFLIANVNLLSGKTQVEQTIENPAFQTLSNDEEITDFVSDGKSIWLRHGLYVTPPRGIRTLVKQRLFLVDIDQAHAKPIEVDIDHSVLQLIGLEPGTENLLLRKGRDLILLSPKGESKIIEKNLFEEDVYTNSHARQSRVLFVDWGKSKSVDIDEPTETPEPKQSSNKAVDLSGIRKEFFRLDHGVIKYLGYPSIGGVFGKSTTVGKLLQWHRDLNAYGFFWKNSPFFSMTIAIAENESLSEKLAEMGLIATPQGELRLLNRSFLNAPLNVLDFLTLMASAEKAWNQAHPETPTNYYRANEYFNDAKPLICEEIILGY